MSARSLLLPSLALAPLLAVDVGCIHDADCGICDPQSLELESISGVNYGARKIHVLSPPCDGDRCPGDRSKGQYFVTEIGPCEQSEDALASPRGPEEYCKLSPLVVAYGLEFIFNNLLEPTAIELVRKRPDQPKLFEVYDWKTRILAIEGPVSRFNGDVRTGNSLDPDVVSRAVNLSCVENLADAGIPFSHVDYEDPASNPCNTVRTVEGESLPRPMKMRIGTPDAFVQSYRGVTTHGSAGAFDCVTEEGGPDTCCTECDWLLSTRIAKYGVTSDGTPRTPNYAEGSPPGNGAIECDPTAGDPFVECRDFIAAVDRGPEQRSYDYHWSCDPSVDADCARESFALPRFDKLRETHPDARPEWTENRTAACDDTQACLDVHDLPGTTCIGTKDGRACDPAVDPECEDGRCRPTWFVDCRADQDTTGPTRGFCVDARYASDDAGACMVARSEFEGQCEVDGSRCRDVRSGSRLALCDSLGGDGALSAAECCQEALGSGIDACDPALQTSLAPLPRYDRNEHLPEQTRTCVCEDDPDPSCAELVEQLCTDGRGRIRDERRGQYAVAFIDRPGGVVYDPALKGFEWQPADIGGLPRARVEQCAEASSLIAPRNRHDGWRANDGNFVESYEDFDRVMCSGSSYRVTFAVPGDGEEAVVDKVGNDLSGKAVYSFETPQFHVAPGTGFPADALRIGACDDFGIQLSNRYDISPENLRKIALYEVETIEPGEQRIPELLAQDGCGVVAVAGGPSCYDDAAALANDPCGAPCLVVDIAENNFGKVRVSVDAVRFESVLQPGHRYRLSIPGLDTIEQIADPERYAQAFWDACGMPLVSGGFADEPDFIYDFDIDDPKCKEDPDDDDIPDSCDNADDLPNTDQNDIDDDGIGDVIDLCPIVATRTGNQGDSDEDGIGNDCDVCRRPLKQYNLVNEPDGGHRMLVDNNPVQTDADGDGIGDACDNCVTVPNCGAFGPEHPWAPGESIPYADVSRCQSDDDADMVGNACVGLFSPGAAAPVGLDDDDDFDQDGLTNAVDKCPRLPVPPAPCESAADCPIGSSCEACPDGGECIGAGVCNHPDSERNADGELAGDGVGDACDTCPGVANPMQRFDANAQESDDFDGDFIGAACETNADCAEIGGTEARPFGFYEVSAAGYCCTLQLEQAEDGTLRYVSSGDVVLDAGVRNAETAVLEREPVPVTLDCVEASDPLLRTCRKLPDAVAQMPGVLVLPPGCEDALGALDWHENPPLTDDDLAPIALWDRMCLLPPLDQDFDGYGDRCDLCKFDYDPENAQFVDLNSRVWPEAGAVCSGGYALDKACAADMTDTDGESSGGSDAGTTADGEPTTGG